MGDSKPVIGMIGLGKMGMPMARHFLAAGYELVGHRRSPAPDFEAAGGRRLDSPAAVFDAAPLIFCCVPEGDALGEVVAGENGFLSGKAQGRVIVEMSTTDLNERLAFDAALRERGSFMLDSPVSGIPIMVERRKAVFMASGDAAAFDRALPHVQVLSDEIHYLGRFGAGTRTKYLANYLVAVHNVAAAEIVALATASGLDARRTVEILAKGAGSSTQLATRGLRMAAGEHDPGQSTLAGLAEDLHMIDRFARSLGLDSGIIGATQEMMTATDTMGLLGEDPAVLVKTVLARMKR